MAKKKDDIDAGTATESTATPESASPAINPNHVPGLAPDNNPTHRVEVKDAPTCLVHAADSANAWERYRQKTGMVQTINTPVVSAIAA